MNPADRDAEILKLHAQGLSRNEIRRRLGCGSGTVTKVVSAAGKTFDRSATHRAVADRRIDLAARRQQQTARLYDAMDLLLERINDPTPVTILRGEGGVESERTVSHLPARDAQQLMAAIKAGRSTAADLERVDNPQARAAASLLTGLAEQLGVSDDPAI